MRVCSLYRNPWSLLSDYTSPLLAWPACERQRLESVCFFCSGQPSKYPTLWLSGFSWSQTTNRFSLSSRGIAGKQKTTKQTFVKVPPSSKPSINYLCLAGFVQVLSHSVTQHERMALTDYLIPENTSILLLGNTKYATASWRVALTL